jgi:hypothetical protein
VSSSRDQITFTGAPTAFDVSTASMTKSPSPRRPNPPPRYAVCTNTLLSGRPVTPIAACCVAVCDCVETQTSQRSACTCAVQFIGSIGACARNGASNTRSITRPPADDSAASAFPSFRATAPGRSASSAYRRRIAALSSVASAPSFQVTSSACAPFDAAQ